MNGNFRNDGGVNGKAKNGIFVMTVILLITLVIVFLTGVAVGRGGRYRGHTRSASRSHVSGRYCDRYDRGRWIDVRGE